MPAVSKKQQRFFGYLLSNPDERKKRGISKKAAKDFAQSVDEAIERQAKDRKKLSQPHSVSGSRRDHSHDVDSALTDHVPRKGKGRVRPASKKEMRVSAMRDAGIKQEEVVYEATREEAEKKRLAKDNPDDYAVRNIGHGKWSTKRKSSMKGQAKRRGEGLKNVDSDLPSKSKERGETKTKKIVGRGKEHHHLTPISQSTKEFKGLSPEQRKAKREKRR